MPSERPSGAPLPPPPPPGGPGAGEAGPFAAPRRLHPSSVVLGLDLRRAVQALIFPVVFGAAGGSRLLVPLLVVVAGGILVARTLAWQRFSFSFDGELLRVREGVLSRNQRALDVARIQQVEIDRSALLRLAGMSALRIETAGSSSEVEVELRVLPEAEAEALRSAVRAGRARALARRGQAPDGPPTGEPGQTGDGPDGLGGPEPERELIAAVPLGHVVLAAVTGARLLVFPAIVAASLQLAGDLATRTFNRVLTGALETLLETGVSGATEGLTPPRWTTIAVAVVLTMVASVLTAIVVGVLREARFRAELVDGDLHLTRGLLSTRDSVVPLRRVQLVEVKRNWARRLLGYAVLRVHSAGGSADGERRVAIPLVRDAEVDRLVAAVLPGVPAVPALTRHPRPALRRSVLRWIRPALLVPAGVAVAGWIGPLDPPGWAGWASWLVPVGAALLGVVEYRNLGHARTDRVVAARTGALSITTALAPVVKVQAASARRSFFQRRLGLATVTAHVAGPGGDLTILDAGDGDATGLQRELTAAAAFPDLPIEPGADRADRADATR